MSRYNRTRITAMTVERGDEISLVFPQVERGKETPLVLSTPRDYGRKPETSNLYFALKSEPVNSMQVGTFNPTAYKNYHPIDVALNAFTDHYGFILTPQNIGANLLLDFGEYINNNAERCAPIFNGKVGEKKKLEVWLNPGESLKSTNVLARAVGEWESGVRKETSSNLRDLLHPGFSEKNQIIDIVYGGLLMGAAKEFFEYSFGTLCGIPEINVTGTRQDWEQIRSLVTALGSTPELSELSQYYDWVNSTVMEGILGLYDGKEDLSFWSSMVKYESMSGSQGQSAGWLPSLTLYGEKNKLLDMKFRWSQQNQDAWQCKKLAVPVVGIDLVSDPNSPVANVDPSLNVHIGFTGVSYNGLLKPVLGIDAYPK